MATTPNVETILEAMLAELEAVEAGATSAKGYAYNYTPEMAVRIPVFSGVSALLTTANNGPYYFLRDDGEVVETDEVSAFGDQGYEMTVPVIVAHRDTRAEKNPLKGAISPGTIQNKMIGDVVAALTTREKHGISNVVETLVPRVDRDFHDVLQNWILAEVFFAVTFHGSLGVP